MELLVPVVVATIFLLGFRLGWQIYRSGRAQPAVSTALVGTITTNAERERRDLRKPLPTGYDLLIQGPELPVVGESNYRSAIERIVGRNPEGHRAIVNAAMVAEPHNKHDPNAIAIQVDGQTIGYLSRPDALRYGPVMDWAAGQGFVPGARADINGGWRQDDGSWADFGVRLHVASPEKLLDPR